jgi:hypoxanthine phosphoribosyltransferase
MDNSGEVRLRLLYSEHRISAAVQGLADRITAEYEGEELLMIVVLKGAFVFAADLVRRIRLPVSLDFIRLSSYSDTETTGEVTMIGALSTPVAGRHVLIVEDIVDTGISLEFLLHDLMGQEPKSIRTCALLDKQVRRLAPVSPDYAGIVADDRFLVGYGLDLNERYRELPAIYELVTNS